MSVALFDVMQEIGDRIGQAPYLLLCFDFDGTLVPLEDNPGDVWLSPEVRSVVQSLTEHPKTTVAVISGRERADLQARIDIPGLIYAGNHGLEISGSGFIFIEPTAVACRAELEALARDLDARFQPIAGVTVEDKGLTISVHYRQADPDKWEEVRRTLHDALARTSHPFHLTAGNMVFDVRPRVYWNKGAAVGWIKDKIARPDVLTLYIGDDTTDEDAFAALPDDITVKVGVGAPTAARYYLESPSDVGGFLAWTDSVLRRQPWQRTGPPWLATGQRS